MRSSLAMLHKTTLLSIIISISAIATPFGTTLHAGGLPVQVGGHNGEAQFLEYTIEYLNPLGITTVGAGGIDFKPYCCVHTHSSTVLPERYFGDYPLYFSDSSLPFRVHITNTGRRTYRHLKVTTVQEFLNPDGGAGVPFPEPNTNQWHIDRLGGGETIVLDGVAPIPNIPGSGIDQTHLQIAHANGGHGAGRIIMDDPQAGIWCPVK